MKLSWLTALVLCACVTIDISEASHHYHHYKKSVIIHNEYAKKKFDIMARPQVSPDSMTVVMKGLDGAPGKQGPQGDRGKPGPTGLQGPMGDQGLKGVCSRTQCENEQLKLLIQRVLALEKYVNSKLKNENNKGGGPPPCKNTTTGKPTTTPCTPVATIIAIVPLTSSLLKPGQGGPQGKGQGQAQVQVPSKGPLKNQGGLGGPTQAKPSQGGPQGQGQGQGQGKPGSSTMNLSVTPSPSGARGTPGNSGAPGTPGNSGAPSSKVQPPGPTPSSVTGTPTAKRPAPPTGQPFVTLQGVTSYDLSIPPVAVPPQQVTVVGGPLNQFTTVPANWVTSGTGPVDLKPALYRRTPISRADKKNFYSRGWDLIKKHKIPSPSHGLLTHKLASKMLSKSNNTKSKVTKTKTIKHSHHHHVFKHHKKVASKKSQQAKTKKVADKKHH